MSSKATIPPMARSSNLPFVLRDYKFTTMIGRGGFAEVFLVEHIKFGTPFVAKVMTVDHSEAEKTWEIFDAETKALSTLSHPHIIRIYDHFQIGAQFYYILEYCPNGSLHDEIKETRGLPFPRFVQLASQIVSALAYCHKNGIAHRDIKPGNILLDELKRAKLADFGLCQQTKAGQLHKTFSGSCEYTAPEIFLRKPNDPMKGDVWALGVVFVIMVSGKSPWKCDSLGALRQLAQNGNYKLSKSFPKCVAEIVAKMLVVDPDQRITMEQLEEMPLFHEVKPKMTKQLSKPSFGSMILQWEPIERVCIDDEFEDFSDDDEYTKQITFSKVRSASSMLMHQAPTRKVKSRLKVTSSASPTFPSIDEDVIYVS